MLVLSRISGESIMIGDDVKVAVTEIQDARTLLIVSHKTSTNGRGVDQTAKHWMKCGEAIEVAGGVVCSVLLIDRGKIRLGFKCPATVKIDRTEIYELNRRKK